MDNSFIKKNSKQFALDDTTVDFSFSHGLGRTPNRIWAEIICIAPDQNIGTKIGDIIDASSINFPGYGPGLTFYADAQMAEVACSISFVGNEDEYRLVPRGGGNGDSGAWTTPTNWANFALVIYAI
jgi:hypothetical protein